MRRLSRRERILARRRERERQQIGAAGEPQPLDSLENATTVVDVCPVGEASSGVEPSCRGQADPAAECESAPIPCAIQPSACDSAAHAKSDQPKPPKSKQNHRLTGTPFCTVNGEPLDLRDLYLDASCFIVLPGPSLATLDLSPTSPLARRGVFTIAVNNAPVLWRPTAWTYVDRAEKFIDSTWKDPGVLKFVNKTHLCKPLRERLPSGEIIRYCNPAAGGREFRVRDMPGVIGTVRNGTFDLENWLSEPSINWGNAKRAHRRNGKPRVLNVMFCVLKLAYSLGFRRVYLLGCDFKMDVEQPYAFPQKKGAGGCANNNQTYRLLNEYFDQLQPRFLDAGFGVFNCTQPSGLCSFPRIEYAAAIEEATGRIPQVPDGSGWYEVCESPPPE